MAEQDKPWYFTSCILGEPDGPRSFEGVSYWASESEACTARDAYCDLCGHDPDDFCVMRKIG